MGCSGVLYIVEVIKMTDNVHGIVIGEITTKHVILYDGREQHSWIDIKLSSDREAKEKTEKWVQEKKNEMGQMLFDRLYPDDKWELRVYN